MDAFNLIILTLPGIAVTYQGEEIGMTNGNITFEDTVDPSGCNCGPDLYQNCSRWVFKKQICCKFVRFTKLSQKVSSYDFTTFFLKSIMIFY